MLKKAILGTLVATGLGAFVFGTDVFSYMSTWGNSVRTAVKSEVPVEFEIERARQEVESLVPEIHEMLHVIAEQEVDIRHKSSEIDRKEMALADQRGAILALRNDLDSGKSTFKYASHTYSSDDVRNDLEKRFKRYKGAETTLTSDRQVLRAWEKTLDANREKLDNLMAVKQDLEVQIEQLEARLKSVQAAEAVASVEVDDTRLARAKKLINELNKQIEVRETKLDMEGKSLGLIPVESASSKAEDNIASEIDDYFGRTPDPSLAEVK